MRGRRIAIILVCAAAVFSGVSWGWAAPEQVRAHRPKANDLDAAVTVLPPEYRSGARAALKKAGRNGWEHVEVIRRAVPSQREGAAFLLVNMPGRDLATLKADFLLENLQLAYQVMAEVPWGKDVPPDVFLNDVLPYAQVNERRDNWRRHFHDTFLKIAQEEKTIGRAALKLNRYVFEHLQVSYSATLRPKPDQSPYESVQARYASCTGLSILLADALRSVGIPARLVGTPLWSDKSGNHTWVEIWDGTWHYVGAAESTKFDQAWFTAKAAAADARHRIYAVSFRKTGVFFPMRWAPRLKFISAEDVTEHYTAR